MPISTEKTSDGKTMLKVDCDLDTMELATDFKDALQKLYEEGESEVVLDLDDVRLINSNGIGKILMFHKRFADRGGQLYYKAPLRGVVKDLFETLLLTKLLKEYGPEGWD